MAIHFLVVAISSRDPTMTSVLDGYLFRHDVDRVCWIHRMFEQVVTGCVWVVWVEKNFRFVANYIYFSFWHLCRSKNHFGCCLHFMQVTQLRACCQSKENLHNFIRIQILTDDNSKWSKDTFLLKITEYWDLIIFAHYLEMLWWDISTTLDFVAGEGVRGRISKMIRNN